MRATKKQSLCTKMKGSDPPQRWKAWQSWNLPSKRMEALQQVSSVVPFVLFLWFTCPYWNKKHFNRSLPTGNASQVSDGAAAVLLAKRSKAAQLGLPVLGVLRSFAVVGVPPDVMGIGPAYAIPVAVEKAGENHLAFRQSRSDSLDWDLRLHYSSLCSCWLQE